MFRRLYVLRVVFLLAWGAAFAAPALSIVYVKPGTPGSGQDGKSWATAYTDLQAALNAAGSYGEVWVAQGTYTGNFTFSPMSADVSVYGGFAGTETSLTQRDPVAHPTILDGAASGSVVTVPEGAGGALLDGFTIRKGTGTPTTADSASRSGGGVYIRSGAQVSNCTIADNTARFGGGVCAYNATVWLLNNRIVRNRATHTDDTYAIAQGGGVFCLGQYLRLANNIIADNKVDAIVPYLPDKYMEARAEAYGGGVYLYRTRADVRSNVFARNTAEAQGWMIDEPRGAALYDAPEDLKLSGNTIVANTADHGAVYLEQPPDAPTATAALTNNLFAQNRTGVIVGGMTAAVRHNDFYQTAIGGATEPVGTNGNIAADPLFADAANGDYHLQPGSPCINAGDNAAVAPGDTDIDGQPRVMGGTVDIGADEVSPPVLDAPIVYVRPDGDDAASGASWALAKRTIAAAMDVTRPGAEVWAAGGTYAASLTLYKAGTSLYGGFAGTETARDQRSPALHPTIIRPSSTESPSYYPAVTVRQNVRDVVLDGLTVTGAFYGVSCEAGSAATLHGNVITGNGSYEIGAGVRCDGATVVLTENAIVSNFGGQGCGIVAKSSVLTVLRNTITDNHSHSDNAVFADGAGVHVDGGTAVIRDNVIARNRVSAYDTYPQFNGLEQADGGGIAAYRANVTIVNNTVVGNSASASMSTTLIARGGGILLSGCQGTLANNIVAFNTAGAAQVTGGGVAITDASSVTVRANLLYGNAPDNGLAVGQNGTVVADPLLVDWRGGDSRLRAGSPAIDAGDNAFVLTGETDRDGDPRIAGLAVDIGAYELQPGAPVTMADAALALRIAAGIYSATPAEAQRLNAVDASSTGVDLRDVVALLRSVAGR